MTLNTFLQKDKDFADAMATKIRLNREKLKKTQTAEDKINNLTDEQKKEIGEFRLGIIKNTIKDNPDIDPYETHRMMREMGY